MINLNKLSELMLQYAEERQENGAAVNTDTMKMLKHCATEVVEATESYYPYKSLKDLTTDGTSFEGFEEPDVVEESFFNNKRDFVSEIADIIACALIIAAKESFDIESALLQCLEKNKRRAEGVGDKK